MKTVLVLLVSFALLTACNKNDNTESSSTEATFSVYLTDGPGMYDAVNIDIEGVQVHFSSDSSEDTWHDVHMARPGVHNLLLLANGKDTLLATDKMAAGKITQVRLILGSDNSVVVAGRTFPLETPSGQESGIKLNVDVQLTAGIEYKLWTDFDAERSIILTGSDKFILKPVIRVYSEAISGSIQGIVQPHESNALVYAINGTDTIASAEPDSLSGAFLINGLAQGTYNVGIDANHDYTDTTIVGVNVTTGAVSDIGTVELHQ